MAGYPLQRWSIEGAHMKSLLALSAHAEKQLLTYFNVNKHLAEEQSMIAR